MKVESSSQFDVVLVGGGLSTCLLALALFELRPRTRVALVEQSAALGGNHLWCFHAGDVRGEADFVTQLVTRRWPGYEVRFPDVRRVLDEPYAAVTSERLDEVVQRAFAERPGARMYLSRAARRVTATRVELDDGEELHGTLVIESRGPLAYPRSPGTAFQKFLGLELVLRSPSPLTRPVLMDALVPQRDGFRFMYALPLSESRVLLEDTYFSETPELEEERISADIMAYAADRGFQVARVARRESGVLPLPTVVPRFAAPAPDAPLEAGYQGGWFHPVTGYSFPVAARLARAVAGSPPEQVRSAVWPLLQREQRAQFRFAVLLNKLMFGAFAPADRSGAIERFYRLPAESIRRFYALDLDPSDRLRLLCGRPPRGFSLKRALQTRLAPAQRAS
jgi:lycopene beta-cyclase